MIEAEEQSLREENIRLRQQARYYQSMHARTVAKLPEKEGIIAALKAKVAELMRRLFGRKSEKKTKDKAGGPSDAGDQSGGQGRPRGQQAGGLGHGRKKRPQLPAPFVRMDPERTARPGAIARKNFYGSGSVWSGELLAMMLTILQTARLHGVNLRGYLTDYLNACAKNQRQAPEDLEPWLPWNYQPRETAQGP